MTTHFQFSPARQSCLFVSTLVLLATAWTSAAASETGDYFALASRQTQPISSVAENSDWSAAFASYERRLQELENQSAEVQSFPTCAPSEGCSCNCCCPGWFATADYLYWQIARDDLGYAINDPGAIGVPAAGQPVLSLDYGSASGIRAAFGRRTVSGWQVDVRYTGLRATDSRVFAPGGSRVLAVLSSPATGLTNANSVNASSEFRYDVFDLEAGHWLDIGDALSLLVQGGIRYTSIDHQLQANYAGGAFVNGRVDVPTDLDALGGRLGGTLHWDAGRNLSLFGSTAISVNATEIDARRQEVNAGAIVIDAGRQLEPVVTSIELQLGARCYFRGWSLAAGYEWTNWFNAVSPLEFSDNFNGGTLGPTQRDLGLHGLFATISYAF